MYLFIYIFINLAIPQAQTSERNFEKRFEKARQAGRLTAEHEAKLTAMDGDATQLAESAALMEDVRALGRLPQHVDDRSEAEIAERNGAKRLKKARCAA